MILVTGAGGFIGSQVCQRLSAHGQDVIAVDRNFRTVLNARSVEGDLSRPEFLTRLFREYSFETIIHLAGLLNRASRQQPYEAMEVNIGCSLHLLQLATQFNVAKFIFGSSISAYGPKHYAEYGEVSETEPASPNNIYGISKRYVEIVGDQYRQENKLQFIALRISMVVGEGATNTASRWRSEIFEKLHTTQHTGIELPYASQELLPLVHVWDVADIITQLVETERVLHTVYNTPSDNWQCGQLADYIRSLNENIELVFNPSDGRGDPEAINGNRLIEELDYKPLPLKERLRRIVKRHEH